MDLRLHDHRRSRPRGGLTGSLMGSFLALLLLWGAAPLADAKPGYLSAPDVHGDQVVFVAEGDLWLTKTDGTGTRRLTSHVGNESRPCFSPDGRWIAFSGIYDGNTDVYVVPTTGGEPRRLTWHPIPDFPVGWTPEGDQIIFVSFRHHAHWSPELFTVPPEGGDVDNVPLGRANWLDIDPISGRYAFTRNWGGGTWKRYRGGTAPDIWVGDPTREDYRRVTEFDGLDVNPMWHGGRIYFLSDQGGTGNIWSMKPDGSDRKRHTTFDTWDARQAAMGPDGRIVFTLAGGVHLYDVKTGEEREIEIDLPSERTLTRKRYPDPGQYVEEFALSPDGERAVVVARGEVFSVPTEEGVTLPITRGSGARENRVVFDPEGERLLYVTDRSGEEELVSADSWGRGKVEVIEGPGVAGRRFQPRYSTDGQWIAYADQTHTLYVIPAEGGERREIDYCEQSEITDYTWSPDGRWLAYSKNNEQYFASIYIYDTQEDQVHRLGDDYTDDYDPAWDPDGRYLYFVSNRTINPMIGGFDFETINVKPCRPYMYLLREDVENPFAETAGVPPIEDEDEDGDAEDGDAEDADGEDGDGADGADDGDEADTEAGDADGAGAGNEDAEGADGADDGDEPDAEADDDADADTEDDADDEEELTPVEIDFEGLASRYLELPVEAGTDIAHAASSCKLFDLSPPTQGMNEPGPGGGGGPSNDLMAFDLEEEEASTFVSGVAGYDLSTEADKLIVSKGRGQLFVVGAAAPPGDLSEAALDLSDLIIELDPQEEWRQIYFESWRHMRDHYWDPGMHGIDWEAVRDQYAQLLPRLATRQDLADLLAEMIGELSTGHTYVGGGDTGTDVPRRSTGLLGGRFEREGGAFRVTRIYRGHDADRVRSPLKEPGVNLKEGDYIFEVNLQPFSLDRSFEAHFENLAGRPVMLTVNDTLDIESARHVVVTPLGSDHRLRYVDWVRQNREEVLEKTDGKIGYVHIPDMSTQGLVEFDRWYYPQLDKEGMIVDARWNGGGFVSQLILSRLQRTIISWDRRRSGAATTYPNRVLNGPFVVLTNEGAGSDGDIFPAAVQLLDLAPVIGTRSWGGVVGIRGFRPSIDKGYMTFPEFAWWDEERGWGLEGRGVEPDIVVENLPQELAKGIDSQLERGIEEVLDLRKKYDRAEPDFGPAPDRSREAYRDEL